MAVLLHMRPLASGPACSSLKQPSSHQRQVLQQIKATYEPSCSAVRLAAQNRRLVRHISHAALASYVSNGRAPVTQSGSLFGRTTCKSRSRKSLGTPNYASRTVSSSQVPKAALAGAAAADTPSDGVGIPSVAISPVKWARIFFSRHDKAIFALMVPAFFATLLDPLLSVVDTAIVGQSLGPASLAAVGLSTIVFNFSNFLFNPLMVLTTPRVARAVVNDNFAEASRATAEALWLAIGVGLCTMVLLWNFGPLLVQGMGGKGEVAKQALIYLRCRCVATPAILSIFVAIGTFRGYQDTKTPLLAAAIANFSNLFMDIWFIWGLKMGIAGAALATSFSQYLSIAVLGTLLVQKGMLRQEDMRRLPGFQAAARFFVDGIPLALRNISSMVVVLFATKVLAGMGAVALAAHEIVRSVWILAIQGFTAFDIAAQTLVATHLGKGNRVVAREVLLRILQLGLMVGGGIAVLLLAGARLLPAIFTSDPAVIAAASRVLPLMALYMPLDACASILDGGLIGASENAYMGKTMLVTAAVCVAALLYARQVHAGVVGVWFAIKLLTVGRATFGFLRIQSPKAAIGPSSS